MLSVVKKYIKGVVGEYKRITFPSWKDVYVTSVYIGVAVVVTAIFVALSDFLISHIVKLIFGIGS